MPSAASGVKTGGEASVIPAHSPTMTDNIHLIASPRNEDPCIAHGCNQAARRLLHGLDSLREVATACLAFSLLAVGTRLIEKLLDTFVDTHRILLFDEHGDEHAVGVITIQLVTIFFFGGGEVE